MKSLSLTDSKGNEYTAFVDNEDFERVSAYQWRVSVTKSYSAATKQTVIKPYAWTQIDKTTLGLQRFILGLEPGGPKVFFVDGNTLNCQRSNLAVRLIGDFWAKVDKTGGPEACWPWKGCLSGDYGALKVNSRIVTAHRHAYELANGFVPDQTPVLHNCRNSLCMNPAHMRLGQQRVITAKPKRRQVDPADRFKGKTDRRKRS